MQILGGLVSFVTLQENHVYKMIFALHIYNFDKLILKENILKKVLHHQIFTIFLSNISFLKVIKKQ